MHNRSVTIQIERNGHSPTVRKDISAEDVAEVVRGLESDSDVTVTISREGTDDRVMVAVNGPMAFLGRDSPDGLSQYVAHENDDRTRSFTVGGQEADIESRYILSLGTAADVVQEWLRGDEESSSGTWERQ